MSENYFQHGNVRTRASLTNLDNEGRPLLTAAMLNFPEKPKLPVKTAVGELVEVLDTQSKKGIGNLGF